LFRGRPTLNTSSFVLHPLPIPHIAFTPLFKIMIEIHGTPYETATLLRLISNHGYWLYSYEINGAWHSLCEFSFIHESAFTRYDATPMARYLN
uniref:Methyltransferase n=1 Tax=Angiostrongylus cantonensis TaxID=6313 RepID=A0A0K0D7P4_ANGCA